MKKLFLLISILVGCQFTNSVELLAQEVDIVPYLKMIESGNIEEPSEKLAELKLVNPDDPSVMFLDAVLTTNGETALKIYNRILEKNPDSKYADASVYRIYSYYYALGLYKTASEYLNKLKTEYPESPYIKIAERKLPQKDDFVTQNLDTQNEKKQETTGLDYKFTIQAGAFSNILNAQQLQKNFEESGLFSEIKDKTVGGTIFHVVYVGKFVTEDEASKFLDVINPRFNLLGRIVKTD
ncbi:MAG: SPOR domain-containing protein [Ignavibacteriaceae bacterium]|nr:SPOR domain-containing protein [Ignavibacteriaceae bacterium]